MTWQRRTALSLEKERTAVGAVRLGPKIRQPPEWCADNAALKVPFGVTRWGRVGSTMISASITVRDWSRRGLTASSARPENNLNRYKALPNGERSPASLIDITMSERATACRRKAGECEPAARLALDPEMRVMYREIAQMWREVASQIEQFDETSRSYNRSRDRSP